MGGHCPFRGLDAPLALASFYHDGGQLELRHAPSRISSRAMNASKTIGYSALAMLLALYVVGAVSHGVVRHIVQTLPLWFPIVWGLREREIAKWAALPCFHIWLFLMTLIWLFLLGLAQVITGHFAPVEIAMTLVVGIASVAGLAAGLRWRTSVSWAKGLSVTAIFAVLQLAALRISFLPAIARDHF
jgi:hypothetical protein